MSYGVSNGRDRWRHVTLKGQTHDPKSLGALYLENSWRCCIGTIANYYTAVKQHSVGYPSNSLASCIGCDYEANVDLWFIFDEHDLFSLSDSYYLISSLSKSYYSHISELHCIHFYRAMHFSAKRGIAIACRLSVRLSVTLVNCDHMGWNSSKIISPLVSMGCSLFATSTWRVCSKGNTPKFGPKVIHPLLIWASETFDRKLRPNGCR